MSAKIKFSDQDCCSDDMRSRKTVFGVARAFESLAQPQLEAAIREARLKAFEECASIVEMMDEGFTTGIYAMRLREEAKLLTDEVQK